MSNAAPAIQFTDVSFQYEGRAPVLEAVNFSLEGGVAASVIGPNGGGKTTLLRLIMGLLEPSSGFVHIFGRSPRQARQDIGYMPQYLNFDPKFPATAEEVVLMGRLPKSWLGFYTRKDRAIAQRCLEAVRMDGARRHSFAKLSGGQRQRVLIARALASEPKILLLDEPTANIDMAVEAQLIRTLRELTEQITVLIVTHDLGFVSTLVEQVICVNRKVWMHGTTEISGKSFEELYGTDLQAVHHHH